MSRFQENPDEIVLEDVMMKLANANCSKEFYTEVHYNFS